MGDIGDVAQLAILSSIFAKELHCIKGKLDVPFSNSFSLAVVIDAVAGVRSGDLVTVVPCAGVFVAVAGA